MTQRSSADTVRKFFVALDARDADGLRDVLHEKVVYLVPAALPAGGSFSGAQSVIDMVALGDTIYRPETMIPKRDPLIVDGDRVVCCFTLDAKTTQGASYRNRYVMLFRVEAGRITEIDEHLDTLYFSRVVMTAD